MTQAPKSYEINNQSALAASFNQVALDPKRSIVVRACAGSGKTWLLTSRIIRLLLDGVPPQHILAITFTKKAAQEMRDRVASILQSLADEPEVNVLKQLTERGLTDAEAKLALPRARALYNEVLGSGQDMPIYTFHAWFYRLLQAAPMGSGVMRDATLLEDASELKELAWADFYKHLNEDTTLLAHYLALVRELGEFTATKMLNESLSQATEIQLVTRECELQGVSVLEALSQELLEETGIQGELGEAAIYQRWSNELNAKGELDTLIQFLSFGDDKKKVLSESLLKVFNANEPMAQYEVFKPYLKSDGTLNKTKIKSTKAQLKQLEGQISEVDYDEAIETLDAGFSAIQMGFADLKALELHKDILPCVDVLIHAYQNIKRRLRQLDFNDIEHQCFELLSNPNTAAYVQVQLDARYKHLLFDEFQDTSPLQWHIIHGWLDAYEHDALKPCVFVVGDVKQSIYRFRKADARLFDAAEQLLVEKYNADVLKTHATRRNSRAVIEWVNGMFNVEECELTEFTSHTTFNEDVGHVACLGLTATVAEVGSEQEVPETDVPAEIAPRDWLDEPLNVIQANVRDDESALLIESIQTLVGAFPVKDEDTNTYRPARYSDILLLVNTRTHLSGYERLLREAHIPFISSRRGGLLDTLEGEDMMALVQWLMTPNDDLSLMHVLRTPIFNASHDDLSALLVAKNSLMTDDFTPSYWQALNEINDLSAPLQRAKTLLNDWLLFAPHLPPHDVLDRIYAQGEVLKQYAMVTPLWLNAQVQANLREFLQLALTVNSGRYPSLSSYLEALKLWQTLDTEGASEAEPIGMANAVKILTVHASKGLEAPIVMLIDMKVKADKAVSNKWFVDWPVDSIKPRHVSWLSTQSRQGDWRKAALEESNHYARIERWNQCYVAMTRARQLLLVSAAEVRQSSKTEEEGDSPAAFTPPKKEGLFDYLQKSLSEVSVDYVLSSSPAQWQAQVEMWTTETEHWHEPVDIAHYEDKRLNSYADFPEEPGVAEAFRERFQPKTPDYQDIARQEAALLGDAWHGALQFVTENFGQCLSNDELIQRFKVTQAQAKQVQIWTQNTLHNPDFQHWFNPDLYDKAVNEMAVVTAKGQVKRIDRWVKTGNDITVIDYKSDWAEDNLIDYELQVKEYVRLVGELYPSCQVEGVLLDAAGRIHKI